VFVNSLIDLGCSEDDGAFHLELSSDFYVLDAKEEKIPYQGGAIFALPVLNEATIDLVGIPHPQYENMFSHHMKEYYEKYKYT